MHVRCGCGAVVDTTAALVKAGWLRNGVGGADLVVRCPACAGPIITERMDEASFCTRCHLLIAAGEIKSCAEPGQVYCELCARRERAKPLDMRIRRIPARAGAA